MSNLKFTETVTGTREVTGIIRDLVLFVHHLREIGMDPIDAPDDALVAAAKEFWDREHGED